MTGLRHAAIAAMLVLTVVAIFFADQYQLYIIALVGLTAVVGVGLNILLGLTGQISLGHVGLYAIGAYVAGIFTVTLGLSFWIAFPLAGLVAGIAGTLLAIPALRVSGPYLAMVTIAFGFVVEQGAAEWKQVTGGWSGIMNIPTPEVGSYSFEEREIALFVVAFTAVVIFLFARLQASPWGMAMRAVRDSEVAGQSIGLNPMTIRTAAFTLSAVLAGLAGAIFASMTNFISPESFPFFQSILFLLVVLIGGSGTIFGPLAGAVVVILLPEFLSFLAEYRLLFVGLLLLVLLLAAPEGIVGGIARLFPKPVPRNVRPPEELDGSGVLPHPPPGTPMAPLEVRDLSISFGGVQAVDEVGFTARRGQITSIIGPNGAGKTTVLNLLCGFYKPDSGEVVFGDDDLAGRSSYVIARAGIGRTYQTTQLFEKMTVVDNLLIAMQRGRLGPLHRALGGAPDNPERLRQAEDLLGFVGYGGPINVPAGQLPHVDKRLVEIARALAHRPQVLTLDEPAAGLSHGDTAKLGALLRRIAGAGIAVILVEHDMSLVMGVSDRVVVLDAGRKIADDTPEAVRKDAQVKKAYLGEGGLEGRARAKGWRGGGEVLEVAGLSAGYGAAPVLRQVDLKVEQGELVCVLGANGAGKSTLMRAVTGLHRPVEGAVLLLGADVTSFAAHRIAGAGMNLVPEGRQVFPELSVVDNIAIGAYHRKDFDAESEIAAMLERFPALAARRDSRAGLLSGGEQQMLAIARGLVAKPLILLLDEPSLGLAPTLVKQLYSLLADLRDEGITILLVDQMAALALSVADRGYVLDSGQIVHAGTAEDIRNEPTLERAYLGDF